MAVDTGKHKVLGVRELGAGAYTLHLEKGDPVDVEDSFGDLSRLFLFIVNGTGISRDDGGTYRSRVTGRLKDNPAPEGCMAYLCGNCDRIHAEVYFKGI